MILPSNPGPIGIFDSGYGGLTILHGLRQMLPQYDYMYLGDNARAPYGSRSFEVVYKFTRQAVLKLFSMGCHLVILGCNTASAKALRSIQQRDIPELDPDQMATHGKKLQHSLAGKLIHHLERARTVRRTGVVAQVHVVILWQHLAQTMQDGEAAISGVKDSDRSGIGRQHHFSFSSSAAVISSPISALR